MAFCDRCKNFLYRLLIYFIVILWPYSRVQNLYKNADSFKTTLAHNFGIKLEDNNENKDTILLTLFFYSFTEFIFTLIGAFDFFVGHLFSMIFFVVSNFIFFNPFAQGNEFKFIGMKVETFFNVGIFFSLGLIAFYPRKEDKEENMVKPKLDLEDDEMKQSMPAIKGKINKK